MDPYVASPSIAMVAGEPSGDLLAASVIPNLRSLFPQDVYLEGIGGDRMQQCGFDSLYPLEKLSVFGYLDAIRHLPELLSIRRNLRNRWIQQPPGVFVGIDAPDFNFSLEYSLKQKGVPTVHFVSPSIWAWRKERIHKIKAAVSRMLVLFPFEVPIYEEAGIPVTYIGHPMAQTVPANLNQHRARNLLSIPDAQFVIALLPGSRESELKYLSVHFLRAAELLCQRSKECYFIVPMANANRKDQFLQYVQAYPTLAKRITIVLQQTPMALEACDMAIVASGTASLETALYQKPMIIAYAVSPILAWFLKRKAYLPWVGLPNILLNESFVPELIQQQLNPSVLADTVWDIVHDEAYKASVVRRFGELRTLLTQDTGTIAAQAIHGTMLQGH